MSGVEQRRKGKVFRTIKTLQRKVKRGRIEDKGVLLWKQLDVEYNRLQTKSGLRPNCTLQGVYIPQRCYVLKERTMAVELLKGENNGKVDIKGEQ